MTSRRHSPAGARRAAAVRALVPLSFIALAAASAACYKPRERPDTPVVTLTLDDTIVGPGGSISGVATATDHSGITLLAVSDSSGDSVFRQKIDFIREYSVQLPFLLHVANDAPINSPVLITVTAIDNELFTVNKDTIAWVRSIP